MHPAQFSCLRESARCKPTPRPPPRPAPRGDAHEGNYTGKVDRTRVENRESRRKKTPPSRCSSPAGAIKSSVGKNSVGNSPRGVRHVQVPRRSFGFGAYAFEFVEDTITQDVRAGKRKSGIFCYFSCTSPSVLNTCSIYAALIFAAESTFVQQTVWFHLDAQLPSPYLQPLHPFP